VSQNAVDASKSSTADGALKPREDAPIVLAIAGCSGSGKTTLAAELARLLGGVHFYFDDYYRDLSHLAPEERCRQNFDDPDLIESPLLVEHVCSLAAGETIQRPSYDFATHTRVIGKFTSISAPNYLIVEGIFALHYPDLLPHYHLKVYVETADELCFERRLNRDVEERGRTPESVRAQYDDTVRPSSLRWVLPSAANADLRVDGSDDLDWKVEQVFTLMRKNGLLRPVAARRS